MADSAQSDFRRAFSRFAARVHRRQAGKLVLSGAALGLGVGAVGSLALWALRLGEWRPAAAALGLVGASVGAFLARRRRWPESNVALYLDARLGSHETVTTALAAESTEPALSHVVERATTILGEADPARVSPRLLARVQVLAPVGLAAIVALSLLPLPPAPPAPPRAPGVESVRLESLPGLERIEALARLKGQSPEQDARLKKLAEQAKKLREALSKGLEKREALSEIAKLRDGIEAERLKLGDRENRPGLDAATQAFANRPALKSAQQALSNGDLTAFDDEMQKLANRAESSDRQTAKEALEEAAKAAREKGAKGLADALESQRRLFERREARSDALRELGESLKGKLSAQAQEDLKEFGSSGNPEAERRLSEALEKALEGLTPEERKRLAERMQKQLEANHGDASPMTKKQLADLAKKLASEDGVDELKKQLRELSKPESSEDAEREQGLGDADRGGSEAERGLGGMPVPMQGEGSGGPGDSGQKPGKGDSATGGPGSKHDTGKGDHQGSTPEVTSRELRSKADARMLPGAPMHGATLGRAPARAGETANELGTGTLGEARKTEVGAVDHADIPEEYREQVGRYFEP